VSDTPPTLSPDLLDLLIDAGNKALNDHYHERACSCPTWPEKCASWKAPGDMFFGYWDTDAFGVGLPAIIAAYEQHKAQQAGTFAAIRRLVDWLDQANGTGDHETTLRLLKLSEEVGEVSQAYIGYVGQNPRKGQTHTATDVADELCDVIVTALVALRRFTDNPEQHLAGKLQHIADRVLAKGEHPHADCVEPHRTSDGYTDCDGRPL
jgi:NTP pyrophosphatase (non-canonical NTP hydrolase)